MNEHAQVIVVGAGHAGCEAALASARAGAETLLITINLDTVAAMPCNPSVGGQGKGHLVREIDAMGGIMGVIADETHLQSRLLNTRKGLAVQAIRVQSDKSAYSKTMRAVLAAAPRLTVIQAVVTGLIFENGRILGVKTQTGDVWLASAVVLATGTFLRGMIHIGEARFSAGRSGEPSAEELGYDLENLNLPVRRFKTGTPPRIATATIDFSNLERQDDEPKTPPFSLWSKRRGLEMRLPCYITRTTQATHEVIRAHIHESALVAGRISGTGPRYCPSIEDKVRKFPEKNAHKVFLEPDDSNGYETYLQGMSTSLPESVQEEYVRTIPGLENARITRPGYAIEYDIVDPNSLYPTLMSRRIPNLFLAGQINGTSGYEEAAAQGLLAGANAALSVLGGKPIILSARDSYLGLMVEEITMKPLSEPYRIFTSRSPWRLELRMSNAESRLCKIAESARLIDEQRRQSLLEREQNFEKILAVFSERNLEINEILQNAEKNLAMPIAKLLKRPDVHLSDIEKFVPEISQLDALAKIELEAKIKYEGYALRQEREIALAENFQNLELPPGFLENLPSAICSESKQRIKAAAPATLGELSRIPGVRSADVAAALATIKSACLNKNS